MNTVLIYVNTSAEVGDADEWLSEKPASVEVKRIGHLTPWMASLKSKERHPLNRCRAPGC